MNDPDLSIIVISCNTKKITLDCLESILKSIKKLSYEIIVIDNASSDGSIDAIKKFSINHDQIRLIENKENVGFGRANNQAFRLSKSDYILFLNTDILVLNDSIEKLYTFFKQNEKSINFLGGKLLNKNLTYQPSCSYFYDLKVTFAALFLRGDYWGLTRYSPESVKEVDWVSGACLLTKRKFFEEVGGFDEGIFMYMDEVDLLYRAKYNGLKTAFCPNAKFIHLGSASSGQRTYPILQVFRGLIYFYQKYYPGSLSYLKFMLQLKARTAVLIGNLFRNTYLEKTYGKALKLPEMVR